MRPAVIAQPLPLLEHRLDVGPGQGGQVGELFQEAMIEGDHRGNLGLLQHDFRDPDAVRVPGAEPGQITLVGGVPGEQVAPQLGH